MSLATILPSNTGLLWANPYQDIMLTSPDCSERINHFMHDILGTIDNNCNNDSLKQHHIVANFDKTDFSCITQAIKINLQFPYNIEIQHPDNFCRMKEIMEQLDNQLPYAAGVLTVEQWRLFGNAMLGLPTPVVISLDPPTYTSLNTIQLEALSLIFSKIEYCGHYVIFDGMFRVDPPLFESVINEIKNTPLRTPSEQNSIEKNLSLSLKWMIDERVFNIANHMGYALIDSREKIDKDIQELRDIASRTSLSCEVII